MTTRANPFVPSPCPLPQGEGPRSVAPPPPRGPQRDPQFGGLPESDAPAQHRARIGRDLLQQLTIDLHERPTRRPAGRVEVAVQLHGGLVIAAGAPDLKLH